MSEYMDVPTILFGSEIENPLQWEVNQSGGYKCPKCGKYCKTRNHLIVHMRTHENPDSYRCTDCNKICKTRVELKMHLWSIHKHKDKRSI